MALNLGWMLDVEQVQSTLKMISRHNDKALFSRKAFNEGVLSLHSSISTLACLIEVQAEQRKFQIKLGWQEIAAARPQKQSRIMPFYIAMREDKIFTFFHKS
jgi:hypothetical protein